MSKEQTCWVHLMKWENLAKGWLAVRWLAQLHDPNYKPKPHYPLHPQRYTRSYENAIFANLQLSRVPFSLNLINDHKFLIQVASKF